MRWISLLLLVASCAPTHVNKVRAGIGPVLDVIGRLMDAYQLEPSQVAADCTIEPAHEPGHVLMLCDLDMGVPLAKGP